MGSAGLSAFKVQFEAEGREFADQAFTRIFRDHDTDFFLDRMTERGLVASGGRAEAIKFLQNTALQAGDVHDIKRTTASLKLIYSFPTNFGCDGTITTQGIGTWASSIATRYH
ncbi:MAG: hypothetical protein E6L08_14465 [Verrucomicrobia bacterium]|nr:MAG: hypothetical protein E6L08_14465 [Verrucomicrobiota bacterium]